MKSWFWNNGPASEGFSEIAATLQLRDRQEARDTYERPTQLRSMDPDKYPTAYGETSIAAYEAALATA